MLSFYTVICLIAVTHGLVLAGVFFFLRHGDRRINRLFSALMLVTSLDVGFTLYFSSLTYQTWPHFIRLNSPLNYLHGPVLFLFVCALTNPDFKLRRVHLWHFLPLVLRAMWSLDFYVLPGADKIIWLETLRNQVPLESYILGSLWQIQRLVYTLAAIVLIWRHRQRQKPWWALVFVALFTLTWVSAFNRYLRLFDLDFELPQTLQTFLIYAIAYLGLVWPRWLAHEPEPKPKYATSGLTEDKAGTLFKQLESAIKTHQVHLEHGLTLRQLSRRLKVNPQHLSQAINQCAKMSFNDFINGARIAAFKALLRDSKKQGLTLEALAFEAGFNSTSTFNAAFRKNEGTTPSKYRKSLGQVGERASETA